MVSQRRQNNPPPATEKRPPSPRRTTATPPAAARASRPRLWNHLHLIILLLVNSLLITGFIGWLLYFYIQLDIPDISSLAQYTPPVASTIVDSQGTPVTRIYRYHRYEIPLAFMPELLPKAFIAAEDARFYQHSGVDGLSILRALFHNLKSGTPGQGGSTITQQVAKALLLSPEKTYTRKLREAILAYRIDKLLTKEEILHIYLNQIYFGSGSYGIEAAAMTYFNKHASELTLAEIALTAGLPQAPSRYSPFKHFDKAKDRQVYVLNRMADDGYITPTAARKAYNQPILLAPEQPAREENKYFIQHVRNYIERVYGADRLLNGGLTIYTTLDQELQRQASKSINTGVEAWEQRQKKKLPTRPQAALVCIETKTGMVRGLMGGLNFQDSQFNRAVQSRRQPGSAFKPLIYAAAFANGLTPATIIIDEPLELQGEGRGLWRPKNFSGEFHGPTTLRNGLIYSRNIVTIKALQEVGLRPLLDLAAQTGITAPLSPNLSLALGSSGLSLLELTAAYTVFSNNGIYHQPLFITKIVDRYGNTIEENNPTSKRVMDDRVAYQITHLLQLVINQGTGKKAAGLPVAAAGKTGTTDSNLDAWFVGYTTTLATGVWVGFDKNYSLGTSETGGKVAAPIWRSFMLQAKRYHQRDADFAVPKGITFIPVDRETGEFRPATMNEQVSWEPFQQEALPWEQKRGEQHNTVLPAE